MNFTINRETILKKLQKLNNLISINQEHPIINNILFQLTSEFLFLISTNLEVELLCKINCITIYTIGDITVPGKKFLNIIRSFPVNSVIQISTDTNKMKIIYKNIYFSLNTTVAQQFPKFKKEIDTVDINISQKKLKNIIYNTQFAMAKQDIRYYLNGMYLEINKNIISAVTTDGYRMAISKISINQSSLYHSIIIPRKTVIELKKILHDTHLPCMIAIGKKTIKIYTDIYTLSSKLIDHEFPNYKSILITNFDQIIPINRLQLKQALDRASILVHQQLQGVKISLGQEKCIINSINEFEEQVKEEFIIDYHDKSTIELTVNINYILDVINVIENDFIKILISNSTSSIYIENIQDVHSLYIIMPLII